MIKINQHNYEAFYLDYLEGNLSEEDSLLLTQFLENNPVLREELEDFELFKLNANPKVQFEKELLHQSIDQGNVEHYIIASIENEIDPYDALELSTYVENNADAQVLASRYQRTILPKQNITYPEKFQLKKRGPVVYYLAPLFGAAAVWLIFIFLSNPTEYPHYDPALAIEPIEFNDPEMVDIVLPLRKEIVATIEMKIRAEDATEIEAEQAEIIPLESNHPTEVHLIEIKRVDEGNSLEQNKLFVAIQLEEEKNEVIEEDQIPQVVVVSQTQPAQLALKSKPGTWAGRTIRKVLFKKEGSTGTNSKGNEIIAAVTNKIGRTTNTGLAYKYQENKKSSSYAISLGRFKFSRTKRKVGQ